MKNLQDWAAVQKVYKQTQSKRKTAIILGISRNTVRKLLKLREPPLYHRTVYNSQIDPYKDKIIEWRIKGFNGTRIFRELKALGYEGSIGPVYRFLRKVDEDDVLHISSKATVRHESPCGDQAQFDWTEYDVLIGNRIRKVYCFAMILAASRKKAVCFSFRVDAASIYEAIQELYDDLGGVTLELLIDNPKALVLNNNPKSETEVRYNPEALMVAKHLGTELNACPCYWPRKKGKIERPFKYIEEQFIKGNSFVDMEDLTRRGKRFVDEWCGEKHTTTQRIPNQHYLLEEKPTLMPLPESHYYITPLKKRKVSADSFISIESNKYSLPVEYAMRNVYYRIMYGFRIEIFDSKEHLIHKTEAFDGKRNVSVDPKHYEAIAPKVSTSIPQIRRDFTERFSNGAKYLEMAGAKYNQPTFHARKIMQLQELYDDDVLDYFIGVSIDEDKLDISSFRALLREYNNGLRDVENELSSVKPEPNDALTRDCTYYELYTEEVLNAEN